MKVQALFTLLLVFALSGCCHINKFAQLDKPIEQVQVNVSFDNKVEVEFTGRRNRQSEFVVGSIAKASYASAQFREMLDVLGGQDLHHALNSKLASALDRNVGWKSADGSRASLRLQVKDFAFIAKDAVSELGVEWQIEASLMLEGDRKHVWRDCFSASMPVPGYSMLKLSRAESESQQRVLEEIALDIAERLTVRLKEELRP